MVASSLIHTPISDTAAREDDIALVSIPARYDVLPQLVVCSPVAGAIRDVGVDACHFEAR